ncbi:hypothetical protein FOA52_011856 [Chlamydomonas sp. UWO 241]|nr:hypothetical protein FOA52_011856 [Chlamydomonas sp. UWO 241]
MAKADAEGMVEAAIAFTTIIKDRLMSPSDLQACLLPVITRNINKEKSDEEVDAWMRAMFALVPLLDKEVLKSEVATLALSKGDVAESQVSRAICARLLGALAKQLSRDEVERLFFKKAMAMCQDVDAGIRVAMAEQLLPIGQAVGADMAQEQVLDELLELLMDEEVRVRADALRSLTGLIDAGLLKGEAVKGRVLPLLRVLMQPSLLEGPSSGGNDLQKALAGCLPMLLTACKGLFETGDAQIALVCFRERLGCHGDGELRRAVVCAAPAFIKAGAAMGLGPYAKEYHPLVSSLLSDPDETVRAAAAERLHEFARVAGADAGATLTRATAAVLRDSCDAVTAAALPMLSVTLTALAVGLNDHAREHAMADVVRALVELEARAGNLRWRAQAGVAGTFACLPRALSPEQVYAEFVPMALRLLSSGAASVRPAAAEGVAQFLRYAGKKERARTDLFLRLVREFARGRSCGARQAFVPVAQHMIASFSSRFVKDWLYDLVLELLYDPVPNVRISVSHLLPSLKQAIRLPEDVDLLERLNNAMSTAMTDTDRDVSLCGRAANETFKRVAVRMGVGTQVVEVNGLGGSSGFEAMDRKREEEEAELGLFSTEHAAEIRAELGPVVVRKRSGVPILQPRSGGGAGVSGALSGLAERTSVERSSGSTVTARLAAAAVAAARAGGAARGPGSGGAAAAAGPLPRASAALLRGGGGPGSPGPSGGAASPSSPARVGVGVKAGGGVGGLGALSAGAGAPGLPGLGRAAAGVLGSGAGARPGAGVGSSPGGGGTKTPLSSPSARFGAGASPTAATAAGRAGAAATAATARRPGPVTPPR